MYFASKSKQMHELLLHHYWQGSSALITCSATSDEANTLSFKGTPSDPRQLLAAESLLKMIKNGFYFALKAPFVLKIFQFLSFFLFMYKNHFTG